MSSNDKEALELIREYKKSWSLLQKFDDGSLGLCKSYVGENFILEYDEALMAVDELKRELGKKGEASKIFGIQKASEFEGIIKNSVFSLEGLSFREFLELENGTTIDKFSLEAILKGHQAIANDLKIKLNLFKKYLKFGYYPFYFNKQSSYYESLLNTINLSIDVDLTSLGLVEQKYTYKLKKLLEVVCQSEPFEVNYTKIAALAEISRAKLYDYIVYLKDASHADNIRTKDQIEQQKQEHTSDSGSAIQI